MGFIDFQIPDVNSFMGDLENCRDRLNENVNNALLEGAKVIESEQKRIISAKSAKLAKLITHKFGVTKKGKMYYKIGYLDGSRVDEWLHGAVLEFGRPGARHRKEIKRKIKTKSGIKEITVKNGAIQEYSHIRRGFELKEESAAERVQKAFDNTLNKLED